MNHRELLEQVRRTSEYSRADAIDQAKHEDSDGYFGFLTGAEWQHACLSPILTELLDGYAEALEALDDGDQYTRKAALTKAKERLERLNGGGE